MTFTTLPPSSAPAPEFSTPPTPPPTQGKSHALAAFAVLALLIVGALGALAISQSNNANQAVNSQIPASVVSQLRLVTTSPPIPTLLLLLPKLPQTTASTTPVLLDTLSSKPMPRQVISTVTTRRM